MPLPEPLWVPEGGDGAGEVDAQRMLGSVAAWDHPSSSRCRPGAVVCALGQKYPPHLGLVRAKVLSAADVGSQLWSRTGPGDALKAFQPFPVSVGCRKA